MLWGWVDYGEKSSLRSSTCPVRMWGVPFNWNSDIPDCVWIPIRGREGMSFFWASSLSFAFSNGLHKVSKWTHSEGWQCGDGSVSPPLYSSPSFPSSMSKGSCPPTAWKKWISALFFGCFPAPAKQGLRRKWSWRKWFRFLGQSMMSSSRPREPLGHSWAGHSESLLISTQVCGGDGGRLHWG